MELNVSLSKGKGKARFFSGLCEVLALDCQVTEGHDILGDVAFERAGTVLDRKGGSVCLVSGRRAGVVLGVKEAGNGGARRAWHPEITRATKDVRRAVRAS